MAWVTAATDPASPISCNPARVCALRLEAVGRRKSTSRHARANVIGTVSWWKLQTIATAANGAARPRIGRFDDQMWRKDGTGSMEAWPRTIKATSNQLSRRRKDAKEGENDEKNKARHEEHEEGTKDTKKSEKTNAGFLAEPQSRREDQRHNSIRRNEFEPGSRPGHARSRRWWMRFAYTPTVFRFAGGFSRFQVFSASPRLCESKLLFLLSFASLRLRESCLDFDFGVEFEVEVAFDSAATSRKRSANAKLCA